MGSFDFWNLSHLFNPDPVDHEPLNTQPELTALWLNWRRRWWVSWLVVLGLTAVGVALGSPEVPVVATVGFLVLLRRMETITTRAAVVAELAGDEPGVAVAKAYGVVLRADLCAFTLLGLIGCAVVAAACYLTDGTQLVIAELVHAAAALLITGGVGQRGVIANEDDLMRYASIKGF